MFGSNVKLHDKKKRSTKDMEHYELAKSFCFLNFTRTNWIENGIEEIEIENLGFPWKL